MPYDDEAKGGESKGGECKGEAKGGDAKGGDDGVECPAPRRPLSFGNPHDLWKRALCDRSPSLTVGIDVTDVVISPNDCDFDEPLRLEVEFAARRPIKGAHWSVGYLVDTVGAKRHVARFTATRPFYIYIYRPLSETSVRSSSARRRRATTKAPTASSSSPSTASRSTASRPPSSRTAASSRPRSTPAAAARSSSSTSWSRSPRRATSSTE